MARNCNTVFRTGQNLVRPRRPDEDEILDALKVLKTTCEYYKGECSGCPLRANDYSCSLTECGSPRELELLKLEEEDVPRKLVL